MATPKTDSTVQTFDSYTAAMAWVQSDLPHIHKDNRVAAGPKQYSYADLADVSKAILTRTGQAGLAWSTSTEYDEQGRFVLRYAMRHPSGEQEAGCWPLPDPASVGPQIVGSALTYARRYSLMCVTGVAPDKDDDGAAAQQSAPQQQRRPEPRPEPVKPVEPNTLGFVVALTDAEDSGASAIRALLPTLRDRFQVLPETPVETVDPETGVVATSSAADLIAAAMQRADKKAAKPTQKVTRLRAGDPDEQAAQWQSDVEGVLA